MLKLTFIFVLQLEYAIKMLNRAFSVVNSLIKAI